MTDRSRSARLAACSAALAFVLGGCVTVPPEEDPVLLKIQEIQERLARLEQRLGTDAIVDMAGEVARLQDDVRSLRGEVEVSRNELMTLAENQRNMFVQLDDRLTVLEGGAVAGGASVAGAGAAAAGATGGTAGAIVAGAPAAGADGPPTDRELYDRGFDLLKEQAYGEAGQAFAELVRTQPDSSLAGAALYWYGETFYVQREFEQALATFDRVLAEYPRSNKAADALLKAGFCHYELGNWQPARASLERVTSLYAGSPAARLAAERLERMRNEGR